MQETKSYKVLSIDAWGNQDDGYDWNNWRYIGEIECDLDNDESVLASLVSLLGGDLIEARQTVIMDDDGYNVVVCDKATGRPLYAVEYGSQF